VAVPRLRQILSKPEQLISEKGHRANTRLQELIRWWPSPGCPTIRLFAEKFRSAR
jgi:hypothetical protein